VLNKVYSFHFLSPSQKNGFDRLFSGYKTEIFRNYASTDSILSRHDATTTMPLRVLFVGRIVRSKGVFELLEATKKLSSTELRVRLKFVGDGPDLCELQQNATSLPAGVVEFCGYLNGTDLDQAYQESDVLALPTYHPEGFPYVFIEAMRAGIPVISTQEGALAYLVRDGHTGFHVQPKDVNSIIERLTTIIRDKSLLHKMSKHCHDFFLRHLSKSAAEKYYTDLLDARGPRRSA